MMRIVVLSIAMLLLAVSFGSAGDQQQNVRTADDGTVAAAADSSMTSDQTVVVYYLHSNRRCPTCQKLEAYTKEAVDSAFSEQLADSTVVWQVVNFQTEGNEHFAKDYKLFTQSVILSRVVDNKEAEWKNLDKIWKLVGNKDEFLSYIQTEVESFLHPTEDQTEKQDG